MARKPDPPVTVSEYASLAALHLGRADERQQKEALDWILRRACRVFSDTVDDDPNVSNVLQGRRQAGLFIINAATTSPKAAAALADLNKTKE